jgi:hypothetical protein
MADEHHAEGRIEPVGKDLACLSDTGAIVSQQGDAIGARRQRAGAFHHLPLHPAAEASLLSSGLGGALISATKHVAIGEDVDLTGMIEPFNKDCHFEPGCRAWRRAIRSASRRRDVECRDHRLVGRRKRGSAGLGPMPTLTGSVASSPQQKNGGADNEEQGPAQAQESDPLE